MNSLKKIINLILCEIVDQPPFKCYIGETINYLQITKSFSKEGVVKNSDDVQIHEFKVVKISQEDQVVMCSHQVISNEKDALIKILSFSSKDLAQVNYKYNKKMTELESFHFHQSSYYKNVDSGKGFESKERRVCSMKIPMGFINPFRGLFENEKFNLVSIGAGRQEGLGIFNICEIESTQYRFVFYENGF